MENSVKMGILQSGMFRALRSRNYRLFITGQTISVIGIWMQNIAMSWLVYRMTGSAFWLGMVGFIAQFPSFLLSPFGGVLADRFSRYRIVLITQCFAMLQAGIVAVLTLTGNIEIWYIVVLSALAGLISAVDIPTRQSFVLDLVESREDLSNAIALNSSVFNVGRLVGPALAGVLIAAVGEGVCFLTNALSYLVVIGALLAMKMSPFKSKVVTSTVFADFSEGFRYVAGSAPISWILLMLSLISFVGMPYTVLMPVFARDILNGDSHTFGFLVASSGVGALGAAIFLASRVNVMGLGSWLMRSMFLFGGGLIAFSFSRSLPLSIVLVLIMGFGMIMQIASSNTLLQTITDDDKRGRVMSFYTMAFMGTTPFGSLLAGGLANSISAPFTLLIGGVMCVTGGIIFATQLPRLRSLVHPIYVKRGIMPEIATGLQTANTLTTPPEEQ